MADTIIPRDEHPGALDLQLDLQLQQLREASPSSYAYLTALEAYIHNQALTTHQQPFDALEISQREALLLHLLEQPRHAQHRGLQRLRSLLLRWYYSSAAGHTSLAYTAPYSHPLLTTEQRAPAA